MFFSPLAGYDLDRWGEEKAMQVAVCVVFRGAIPVFFFLQMLPPIFILLGQAFLGMLTAGIAGAGHEFMQNFFPMHVRDRGVFILVWHCVVGQPQCC